MCSHKSSGTTIPFRDSTIKLFVREIRTDHGSPPVLLIHGGGFRGLAVFDLNVPGYSLASTIATAGYDTYVMDIRGFGRSTRPASLNPTDNSAPPVGTSEEAVRDIGAVVKWIRARSQNAKVALIGHASGGHWAGRYTANHNDNVSHLVLIQQQSHKPFTKSSPEVFDDVIAFKFSVHKHIQSILKI